LTQRLALYDQCAEDYLALVSSRPDIPAYRSGLIVAETNIAQVKYRQGDNQEAFLHVQTALDQAMALVNADATVASSHALEVYVRVTAGQILRDLDDFSNAELAFESSDEKCGQLVEIYPENGTYRRLHGEVKNGVGILYLLDLRIDEARLAFSSAIEDFDKALKINPNDALSRNGRAWSLTYLGDAQFQLGLTSEAKLSYGRAIAERDALCVGKTGISEYHIARAWLLLTCQDVSLRRVGLGGSIASELVSNDPQNGRFHMLDGLAKLRAKNYPGAIAALNKTSLVQMSKKSPVEFIRAMAIWLNGDKPEAITAWHAAEMSMMKVAPGDIKLRQLRIESAKLLGIDLTAEPPETENVPKEASKSNAAADPDR
jgi:tetratricopeptide (TPR) repeat protein